MKKLKRNFNFYSSALGAGAFVVLGVLHLYLVFRVGSIGDGSWDDLRGSPLFGGIFAAGGLYWLYYLFSKAEKEELSYSNYYELDPFKDRIRGHVVSFEKRSTSVVGPKGISYPAFEYVLIVELKDERFKGLSLYRRDRFQVFLWLMGLTRFWDILTGKAYFDSRFCVEAEYVEGPYDERSRIFDPHRGRLEAVVSELIEVAELIKLSVARNKAS